LDPNPSNQCVTYLWALVHSHRIMKEFIDTRFHNHGAIALVIFKTHVTRVSLASAKKRLEGCISVLEKGKDGNKWGLAKEGPPGGRHFARNPLFGGKEIHIWCDYGGLAYLDNGSPITRMGCQGSYCKEQSMVFGHTHLEPDLHPLQVC